MAKPKAVKVDPVDLIATHNTGRDRRVLRSKFKQMAEKAFPFLRATADLYYARLDIAKLPPSPIGWMCGDLHIENFGVFKGANRLDYFDINDFDEGALMPAAAEMIRFAASILVGSKGLKLDDKLAVTLATTALEAYREALRKGHAFWCEPETAEGAIAELFETSAKRTQKKFLDKRTNIVGKQRNIEIDEDRYLKLDVSEKDPKKPEIAAAISSLAHNGLPNVNADWLHLEDAAYRIAGLGSLGLKRFAALVKGDGDLDGNNLLDLKEAKASAAAEFWPKLQPKNTDEARRVIEVQLRCQAAAPAFLTTLKIGQKSYVVRELQPQDDKLGIDDLARKPKKFAATLRTMGEVAAWSQLRSAGRSGAEGPDAFIAYGDKFDIERILELAQVAAARNDADFKIFSAAVKEKDARLTSLYSETPTKKKPASGKKP